LYNESKLKELNSSRKNILRFGLNHPILPKSVEKDQIKINVEKLVYSLKKNQKFKMDSDFKDDLKFLVKKFVDDGTKFCNKRPNQAIHRTLKNLTKDSTIKVCRFDKGNSVAILNTDDYFNKLDAIVSD